MRTPPAVSILLVSCSLLVTACAAHRVDGGRSPTGERSPQGSVDEVANEPAGRGIPAGRPASPPQFMPVAEADWDLTQPIVGSEIPCRNGKIWSFDCQATSLLAFLPVDSIGGGTLNDIWGWTDSLTGREFALVARRDGTSFVEITDPLNPRYLGNLPFHAGAKPTTWRDVKVYKSHAFIVSGGGVPHGVQVFDLTQLRKVADPPALFQETAHYGRLNGIHNIAINEATGFAYAVGNRGGGETCGEGMHMIDVRTPTKPTFAGCYAETFQGSRSSGYIHDTQCVIYRGPDQPHRGRELCFNAAERAISIVDVTDKQNVAVISTAAYPDVGYTHQGWLSEDHRYFFLGDEADEGRVAKRIGERRTRTLVFDVTELGDPVLLAEFFGNAPDVDHNMYVRGRYLYQSNYGAGLRIIDVKDPKALKEVGYFHSPKGSSWSNYPYFTNHPDVVVFTSGSQGLFIVRHRPQPEPGV